MVYFLLITKTNRPAYANNEINSEKITKPLRVFQLSLGATNRKIDDLSICPPNIILNFFACWLYLFLPIDQCKTFLKAMNDQSSHLADIHKDRQLRLCKGYVVVIAILLKYKNVLVTLF